MVNEIKIEATGKDILTLAIGIVLKEHTNINSFKIMCGNLYFTQITKGDTSKGYTELPIKMNTQLLTDFIWQWLEENPPIYKEPNTDGSVGKGFSLFSTNMSIWDSNEYPKLKIEPIWMIYGK